VKGVSDEKEGNLIAWKLPAGTIEARFFQKEYKPTQWPSLQWTSDEALCARLVSSGSEVQFFAGQELAGGVINRLKLDNAFAGFELSPAPSQPYKIAVWLPMKRDLPAQVRVFEYPNLEEEQVKAAKSFFKAETVHMKWSPQGQALLIQTATESASNTYYGESALHLLFADGSFQATVPFGTNDGPVQDARWSPTGKDFLVIQGKQPAQAYVFLAQGCTPLFELGRAPRNTIRYSPHGRFVCLGGFGNLPGQMDFWDMNKKKIIGTCQDLGGAKSFEWTPDSRSFITAVLHPWRRVDNGYKVWSYAGELVYAHNIAVCYQVAVRPAPKNVYPDRPQSPRLKLKEKEASAASTSAAGASSGSLSGAGSGAPSKPTAAGAGAGITTLKQAYVPPHLRNRAAVVPGAPVSSTGAAVMAGTSTGPSLAERLRTEKGAGEGPKRLSQLEQARLTSAAGLPIGAAMGAASEAAEAAKARAEKRRQKRARKAAAKAAGGAGDDDNDDDDADSGDEKKPAAAPASKAPAVVAQPAAPTGPPVPPEQKAKNLERRLRQIDELKARQQKGDTLDAQQLEKLASEQGLRQELAALKL